MELELLLKMQSELDKIILERKDIEISEKDLLHCRIIAMFTEIGEFCNENASWKYWKKSWKKNKEKTLEEWIDILFFYLSISNLLGYSEKDIVDKYLEKWKTNKERAEGSY